MQKWLDDYVTALYGICDLIRKQIQNRITQDIRELKRIRDTDIRNRSAQEWTFLQTFDEESQYNEFLIDKVEEFREVVAAWRRTARKVKSA